MFGRIFPSSLSSAQRMISLMILPSNTFTSLATTSNAVVSSPLNTAWSFTQIRTKIRNYFPRANENRRLKKHGLKVRMSTPEGRKIIMRRILKGFHVLAH